MDRRIEWIDISKFIAISLMVAGHIGIPGVLSKMVHIFHMPIFFLLAGMVFNSEKYVRFGKYVWVRFKQLIIPYYTWGVISYVLYVPFCKVTGIQYYGITTFLKELFFMNAANPLFTGYGITQWFFPSMFFCSVLSWIIIFVSSKSKYSNYIRILSIIISLVITWLMIKIKFPNYIRHKLFYIWKPYKKCHRHYN